MALNNNNNEEYIFPYNISLIDPEINKELLQHFHGERNGFVQVGPEKYFFPQIYKDVYKRFYNFEARPDDIWIATFPRSGTTWTQELVWLIANDLNFDAAQQEPLTKRFPFFEFSMFMHEEVKEELLELNAHDPNKCDFIEKISLPGYEFLPKIEGKRFIKTHFPFSLLPPSIMEKQAKVIYVARNPKDVAVSYYHLSRLYKTTGYVSDFPRFWSYFNQNLLPWMPYWSHLKEGWAHKNHSNVLFMFYENMNKDFASTIRKVANFLEKSITEDQVEKLSNYLNIKNFKNNPAVNGNELRAVNVLNTNEPGFVRNGQNGAWEKEFSPELINEANRWFEDNIKETSIEFP